MRSFAPIAVLLTLAAGPVAGQSLGLSEQGGAPAAQGLGSSSTELDVLADNSTQVTDLQSALSNNSALNDYLSGNDISASDVVALDNNQDGSLVIYTNSDE